MRPKGAEIQLAPADDMGPGELLAGRLELLGRQMPFVLLGNLVVSSVLAWLLAGRVGESGLYLWISLIWALSLLRWGLDAGLRYSPERARFRLLAFMLGSALSGLAWGSSWLLLPSLAKAATRS